MNIDNVENSVHLYSLEQTINRLRVLKEKAKEGDVKFIFGRKAVFRGGKWMVLDKKIKGSPDSKAQSHKPKDTDTSLPLMQIKALRRELDDLKTKLGQPMPPQDFKKLSNKKTLLEDTISAMDSSDPDNEDTLETDDRGHLKSYLDNINTAINSMKPCELEILSIMLNIDADTDLDEDIDFEVLYSTIEEIRENGCDYYLFGSGKKELEAKRTENLNKLMGRENE